MILNWILIILGILTSALALWNIVVGSFIWGALFLLGGIWSIWLGSYYIIEDKKKAEAEALEKRRKVRLEKRYEDKKPLDEGLLTIDLFDSTETKNIILNESSNYNPVTNDEVINIEEESTPETSNSEETESDNRSIMEKHVEEMQITKPLDLNSEDDPN